METVAFTSYVQSASHIASADTFTVVPPYLSRSILKSR
jgi:hypothetical protein